MSLTEEVSGGVTYRGGEWRCHLQEVNGGVTNRGGEWEVSLTEEVSGRCHLQRR